MLMMPNCLVKIGINPRIIKKKFIKCHTFSKLCFIIKLRILVKFTLATKYVTVYVTPIYSGNATLK